MTDENSTVEIPEHRNYRIRLRRTQVDWIGFVARRGQRPTVILGADRDALIAKAHAWIEGQAAIETCD
jgi:hypothetical protein